MLIGGANCVSDCVGARPGGRAAHLTRCHISAGGARLPRPAISARNKLPIPALPAYCLIINASFAALCFVVEFSHRAEDA